MKKLYIILALLQFACLVSCEKEELISPSSQSSSTINNPIVIQSCGQVTTVDFMAGQHINVGSVVVSNDAQNLFVTYTSTDGWKIKQTHLYVGACELMPVNGGGNPQVGKFPYSTSHDPMVTTFVYTIPLTSLPSCICVAAHAEVVKVNASGVIIDSQTAWGKGDSFSKGSWAMRFEYCKQTCVLTSQCYQAFFAWADGNQYSSGTADPATFVTYNGLGQNVYLYAPDALIAGNVSISPVKNGNVTITITFNENWGIAPNQDAVKIQGYNNVAPYGNSVNPASFTTYVGNSMVITVPKYTYYGIYVDVRHYFECD